MTSLKLLCGLLGVVMMSQLMMSCAVGRLRTRRHVFELPTIMYEFNKRNFIVRSLFNYVRFYLVLYVIVLFPTLPTHLYNTLITQRAYVIHLHDIIIIITTITIII